MIITYNKTFYPFFFYEAFLCFCNYDDNVQIWRSKLQYTLHLKGLAQLLLCNVFHTVMQLEGKSYFVYIKNKQQYLWSLKT